MQINHIHQVGEIINCWRRRHGCEWKNRFGGWMNGSEVSGGEEYDQIEINIHKIKPGMK
jgi:hypothetical protein